MEINQGSFSMSALPRNQRVWLDRGVAFGKLLRRLSTLRVLEQLRRLGAAGLTGQASTRRASETGRP
jgi:hypothetical protein